MGEGPDLFRAQRGILGGWSTECIEGNEAEGGADSLGCGV